MVNLWTYPGTDPREMPSLVLAYIGDAVYELYVRMFLLKKGTGRVNKLHGEASSLVNASRQADFMRRLEEILTEEEKSIAKRGRNAKGSHAPKNADVVDYRLSTGFEALLGYLFLLRREERIKQLLEYLWGREENYG